MIKKKQLNTLVVIICSFIFLNSCSSDDKNNNDEDDPIIITDTDGPEPLDPDPIDEETLDLQRRFAFDQNIVIENSYNTSCDSIPCSTVSESLMDIFVNATPDDTYFYLADDGQVLNLECQLDKGRRIEFKQISKGPLTSFAKIEFEGTYYNIPENGVTIAQVHNRGGATNEPFFRLVLHKEGLETVIRKDPEVNSNDTSFLKEDFSFINGADYDLSSLKIVLDKNNGFVNISVEQNDVIILDASYAADPSTDWVNDSGIANGFFLKAGLYNDDGPHTENLLVGYSAVAFESEDQQ